jgi:hemoglobin-like flavoprotein
MMVEGNPMYAMWYAQDQQLMSFLLNSMTKEVLGQVATESVADAWRTIVGMFSS